MPNPFDINIEYANLQHPLIHHFVHDRYGFPFYRFRLQWFKLVLDDLRSHSARITLKVLINYENNNVQSAYVYPIIYRLKATIITNR